MVSIRVMAVKVVRNGQNLSIFSKSSQQNPCMEYEEKRDIEDDSKIFILCNQKNDIATY